MERKLSIEEFNDYKERLLKKISDYQNLSDNLSNEENKDLSLKYLDEYVDLEKELFNNDLSAIPFEAYKDMTIGPNDGDVLDLSKSHANIDFDIIDIFGTVDFHNCNLKNITSSQGLLNSLYFDDVIVNTYKDLFLSPKLPKEFRNKWFNNELTISDVSNLPEELFDLLPDEKFLYNHLYNDATSIKYLGIKMTVCLYKYSESKYQFILKLLDAMDNYILMNIDKSITDPDDLIENIFEIIKQSLYHDNRVNEKIVSEMAKNSFSSAFILENRGFFAEVVAYYFINKSITEVPDFLKILYDKIIPRYDTLEDLKNYNERICILDICQRNLLDKVSVANILKIDSETKIFSSQDKPMHYIDLLALFIKKSSYAKINYQNNYEEFREFFARCLNGMRREEYFKYANKDYRFIKGNFREDFKDIFISDDAPDELVNVFYKDEITSEFIRVHPDYSTYLLRENLINAINFEGQVKENFAIYYTKRFGNQALLKLFITYGGLINGTVINFNLAPDISKDTIDNIIMDRVYNFLSMNSCNYRFLEDNTLFTEKHPDLFLKPEELKIIYQSEKDKIIEEFYKGNLKYNDIFFYPGIVDVLKMKNLIKAFRKNRFYAGSKSEAETYINKLGQEVFLELCVKYGRFLEATIGLLRTNDFASLETLYQGLEKIIYKRVSQDGFKFAEEEIPLFLKEKHPELVLDRNVPYELRTSFYEGLTFQKLRIYAKEWLPYLKDKNILSSLIRSGEYPMESLIAYFYNFGSSKAVELGIKKWETIKEMLNTNQVSLIKTWYDKTGQTFIPDYVVMQNVPENDIDKFLTSRLNWAKLMQIKEFAKTFEGRDAMLKLAWIFGTFDNDQSGFKKCQDLLKKLPTKVNCDIGNALKNLDNAIRGIIDPNTYFRRNEIPNIYGTMKNEGLQLPKEKVFQSLYRQSDDGSYVLTIDQQKYPKSTALFREKLSEFSEFPAISASLAHQLFGGFNLIYDKDFYQFLLTNLDTIIADTENSKYLAAVQKQFAKIKIANSNRHLTWNLAVRYVVVNEYKDLEIGNEKMAKESSLAGYTQDEFAILQRVYDYGKQRTLSSIPRIINDTNGYHYEILRLDDPLALSIGTMTDCCQEINNAAEICMVHSMTSHNGRIFVIKDTIGNIVAQSWVWRNGNTLCFDNIEIPKKAFERALADRVDFTNEIYNIYKRAAKELIEQDKKVYDEMLDNGDITQEQYDDFVLSKVTVGLGYNDIANSLSENAKLDKGVVTKPLDYKPPFQFQRNLYTNDSITQYILEENDSNKTNNQNATLSVHHDEFTIYDNTNFTKDDLYHLQQLEYVTKKDKSNFKTKLNDNETNDIMVSLAYNYNLNPKTIRIIYNANFALIYDYDDSTIHIGDILYNKNIGLNQENDISSAIMLQLYFALEQIRGNKMFDTGRLNSSQLAIFNDSNILSNKEESYGR